MPFDSVNSNKPAANRREAAGAHGSADVVVGIASAADAEELAHIAAATFPLACPPGAAQPNIAAFIASMLSVQRFGEYLADPARMVLRATVDGRIAGYVMLVDGPIADPAIRAAVTVTPTVELSKFYVDAARHGAGVATALMAAAADTAGARGARGMWLGVNQENERAQRFYRRSGFEVVCTKQFPMGDELHDDFVMQRTL
ncbi:GNAT family N-acetyltransferase [Speluncibacter jeojiensis]|uniref:GNAT family N-acetyltransferase n=1 Tax=Speluncibacter jeojiensis TaxID=2710754 RepID=UPI002FC771F4